MDDEEVKIPVKNEKKSTHILLKGNKIIISPDVRIIFDFLIEIEKEIKTLLSVKNHIKEIQNKSIELLQILSEKVEKYDNESGILLKIENY